MVFNGSFYYVSRYDSKIIKFNLNTRKKMEESIPDLDSTGPSLYKAGFNFMDLNIDDNGLWVIFGIPTGDAENSNNTGVMKVSISDLTLFLYSKALKSW